MYQKPNEVDCIYPNSSDLGHQNSNLIMS